MCGGGGWRGKKTECVSSVEDFFFLCCSLKIILSYFNYYPLSTCIMVLISPFSKIQLLKNLVRIGCIISSSRL